MPKALTFSVPISTIERADMAPALSTDKPYWYVLRQPNTLDICVWYIFFSIYVRKICPVSEYIKRLGSSTPLQWLQFTEDSNKKSV